MSKLIYIALSIITFSVLMTLGISIIASAGNDEKTPMYKTRSILYPANYAEIIRKNAKEEWAKPIYDRIMKDVAPYENLSYDELWEMMFPHTIQKRELMVSAYGNCPVCHEPNQIYAWLSDPVTYPWKMQCPHCLELFPKNDFKAFYDSGIDPVTGIYQRELADESLLYNGECKAAGPDSNGNCKHGNPYDHCGFCVDDGTGYLGTDINGKPYRWYFIGCYLYRGQWMMYVLDSINCLAGAYMVTGEVEYARKAAIVIDRIADLYPDFNYKTQGLVYEKNTSDGYVTYSIDSISDSRFLAEAYDMIFDGIKGDRILVDFLSGKAKQYPEGIAPKDTFEDVQRNIEERILLESINHPAKLHSNYPRVDIGIAIMKCVLDLPGAKESVEEVLGGIIKTNTGVDGLSGEKGLTNYSAFAVQAIAPMIAKFTAIDENLLANLLKKYPSLYDTYRFYADLWYDGERYPHQGDGGWYGEKNLLYGAVTTSQQGIKALWELALSPSLYSYLWDLYKITGDTMFVKIMYINNGRKVDGLPHDIMRDDSAEIQREIAEIIAREGTEFYSGNVNKQNWGIAMLRSNEQNSGPAVWLNYQSVGPHGHYDALNLGMFAYGFDLMPDQGYPPVGYEGAWGSPQALFNIETWSHNHVVVNKRNENPSLGKTTLWADGKVFSAIRVDQERAYGATSRYERTVALIDIDGKNAYALDLFRVSGGSEHIKLMASMPGKVTTTGLNLNPAAFLSDLKNLAPLVSNEKTDANPAVGFTVDWNVEDLPEPYNYNNGTDVHLKYTDLTTDVTVNIFDAWTNYGNYNTATEETITTRLAVIRTGTDLESTFLGIIEPYKGTSNIAEIKRLTLTDENGNVLPDTYAAVEVTLANGCTDIIVAADPLLFKDGDVMIVGDIKVSSELAFLRFTPDNELKRVAVYGGRVDIDGGGHIANGYREEILIIDEIETIEILEYENEIETETEQPVNILNLLWIGLGVIAAGLIALGTVLLLKKKKQA